MGNLGWAEVAVIMVVALMVLGPDKLPGAARQFGNVIRQFRRITTGFQQELQNALDEPIEAEARRKGEEAVKQANQASEPDAEQPLSNPESEPDAEQPLSNPESEPDAEQPLGSPESEPDAEQPPSSQ